MVSGSRAADDREDATLGGGRAQTATRGAAPPRRNSQTGESGDRREGRGCEGRGATRVGFLSRRHTDLKLETGDGHTSLRE